MLYIILYIISYNIIYNIIYSIISYYIILYNIILRPIVLYGTVPPLGNRINGTLPSRKYKINTHKYIMQMILQHFPRLQGGPPLHA